MNTTRNPDQETTPMTTTTIRVQAIDEAPAFDWNRLNFTAERLAAEIDEVLRTAPLDSAIVADAAERAIDLWHFAMAAGMSEVAYRAVKRLRSLADLYASIATANLAAATLWRSRASRLDSASAITSARVKHNSTLLAETLADATPEQIEAVENRTVARLSADSGETIGLRLVPKARVLRVVVDGDGHGHIVVHHLAECDPLVILVRAGRDSLGNTVVLNAWLPLTPAVGEPRRVPVSLGAKATAHIEACLAAHD